MLRRAWFAICLLVGWLLIAALLTTYSPLRAQDIPPFATNTPSIATATPYAPDAALDLYALRLWDEEALVGILLDQVRNLRAGDAEGGLAIRLLQHELEHRFPGAPHDAHQRDVLLGAMLAAPRGSVDMRTLVHTALENTLNQHQPLALNASRIEANGWLFDLTPANVDNRAPGDILVHALYPDSAAPGAGVYEEYVFAGVDPSGRYHIFAADYPAAPLGDVEQITLFSSDDVNGDNSDDLALILERGELNDELVLLGWRGSQVENLVTPGQRIGFGRLAPSQPNTGTFSAQVYRLESTRWGCIAEQTIEWTWALNYFRPNARGAFADQPSLACTLYEAEPLFAQPLGEAIALVSSALDASADAAPRAQLGLAVLYALDGQNEQAIRLAQETIDPSLDTQIAALLDSIADGDTPVQTCAALAAAAESLDSALCDVDALLSRLFEEEPLQRDIPIPEQLAEHGIRVRDNTILRQVGRFDRQVFSFDLAGLRWWAFAPHDPDVYTAERIDPPTGYAATPRPPRRLSAPERALAALLEGDYAGALVALDNAEREQPNVPLTPEFLYLRALAHDLTGNRSVARPAYYNLWRDNPSNLWGQLAAAHLERR